MHKDYITMYTEHFTKTHLLEEVYSLVTEFRYNMTHRPNLFWLLNYRKWSGFTPSNRISSCVWSVLHRNARIWYPRLAGAEVQCDDSISIYDIVWMADHLRAIKVKHTITVAFSGEGRSHRTLGARIPLEVWRQMKTWNCLNECYCVNEIVMFQEFTKSYEF
jgi:hypothetical protein